MPPKNMISVTRKIQMPSVSASCCCARSSNWCAKPVCSACVSATAGFLLGCVGVRFFGHDRHLRKILSWRRGRGLPFEARRTPRVCFSHGPVTHRPDKINQGNQVPDAQYRGSGGRHHIQHLKFRRIEGVAPGHAEISKYELWEKCEVESDKNDGRGERCPSIGILSPGNFGPPEVHPAQITHHRATHHDVVEVGH